MGQHKLRNSLFATLLVLLPVTATQAQDDPFERFNRAMFTFNDTLDTYALKPLAQGYQAVTPQIVEDGIGNMFNNVGEVRNFANNLLQAKFHNAGVDTGRFLINTTAGLLGFFDVAKKVGLPRNDEDLGQTLGVWGVSSGPYLVLPFFGPSTVRDGLAAIPDAYTGPYPYIDDVRTRNSVRALDIVNKRAELLKFDNMIRGDKYIFVRNAYLQTREFRVRDGQVEDDF